MVRPAGVIRRTVDRNTNRHADKWGHRSSGTCTALRHKAVSATGNKSAATGEMVGALAPSHHLHCRGQQLRALP